MNENKLGRWGSWGKKQTNEVEKREGLTLTGKRKYNHISPTLLELRWLPIKDMLHLRDVTMVYKCQHIGRLAQTLHHRSLSRVYTNKFSLTSFP